MTDFDHVAKIWNTVFPFERANLDEMRRDENSLPEANRPVYWLAYQNDEPVGMATVEHPIGVEHDRYWMLRVGVQVGHRRQGLGRRLYVAALNHVLLHNAQVVVTRVPEGGAENVGFANRRGFLETKRDFVSVLDLSRVNEEETARMARIAEGYRLRCGCELDSDGFRRQFHAAFEEVRGDVPREVPPRALTFEMFDEYVTSDPAFLMEGSFFVLEGETIVGFTGIFKDDEGRLSQWLTAVRRPWRGKGLAQALKARQILWAIESGYRLIQTDNDSRNAPMLAINGKLGFERRPGMISLRKVLDEPSDVHNPTAGGNAGT